MGYTISKEATEIGTRLELCPFMRKKRDKTSTTKNLKRGVVKGLTIEELEGWFVVCSWWSDTINGINSSKYSLTPNALKNRGKNEKGTDNIKNVMMFSFCTTILLRGIWTRLVRECYLRRRGKIYYYIPKHYLTERS